MATLKSIVQLDGRNRLPSVSLPLVSTVKPRQIANLVLLGSQESGVVVQPPPRWTFMLAEPQMNSMDRP